VQGKATSEADRPHPADWPKTTEMATVSARLRQLLAEDEMFQFTPDLSDDTPLVDAGVLDSFAMIALVIHIERTFEIKVLPEEATVDRFRSIASIAAYVESKLNGNHRG
jgi:acyl carrier protein